METSTSISARTEWLKKVKFGSFGNWIGYHVKDFFVVILGIWLLKLVIKLWSKRMYVEQKIVPKDECL